MNFRLYLLASVALAICSFPVHYCGAAEAPGVTVAAVAAPGVTAPATAPRIDKIDPPDWFAGLPDPMLLLHGEGFKGARFQVAGKGVTLARSQVSENGHWAFLWLASTNKSHQQLQISAVNSAGKAQSLFLLKERRTSPQLHQGFNTSDAMYLIMPDRFADGDSTNDEPEYDRSRPRGWHGGDLRGIEQHLDYLKDLGMTTIWTTPVYKNGPTPESYHGYGATDMYRVEPHFGTLSDYQRLAAAVHAHGMKLVLDTVPNHVGPLHPWVQDSPAPDWFHGTYAHHTTAKGDFRSLPDLHAPWLDQRDVTEGWFAGLLPDLNQENPLVEQYLIQNAMWWVETAELDGLRLDTFPYVGRAFWQDFHRELHRVYPRLTTVGEVFDADPANTSFFAGGQTQRGIDTGVDTLFDYPLSTALRKVLLEGAPMSLLADTLRLDRLYPHPERLVLFLGNHDIERFLSEPNATDGRLEVALGLIATLRGAPQFYSGDEVAMRGGKDPDNRRDFPGGFPGDTRSAFSAAQRTHEEEEIFEWTKGLLSVRAEHPALQRGLQQNILANDSTIAYVRAEDVSTGCGAGSKGERLLVIASKAEKPGPVTLETQETALSGCREFTPVFPAGPAAVSVTGTMLKVDLPAQGFVILQTR